MENIMPNQSLATMPNGYVILSARDVKTQHVPVSSADEASAAWQAFRNANVLGASDLKRDSGQIWSKRGQFVGQVSYNGRVWDHTKKSLLQEAF